MQEAVSPLAAWENFYVIIGSSAAALTGLQFVVIVLGAEANTLAGGTVAAFGTPTVVHFCAVLLVSALLSAPWTGLDGAGFCLVAAGLAGMLYVIQVTRRARRQTSYRPVLEDWVWHAILPLVGYLALLSSAIWLPRYPAPSLFGVGGTAMLLLFIGIHNAWDSVIYIATERRRPEG
jgi:hypothetical protein